MIRRSDGLRSEESETQAAFQQQGNSTVATQINQPPHGSPAWFFRMVERAEDGNVLTEKVKITPELAMTILQNNPNNRPIRSAKLAQLTADIQACRWVFNGEPILISNEGLLNDGQHRLQAVIDARAPILALMVFGLERSSRTTVDQGAARSAGDYLGMGGVKYANTVAAIGRFLIAYEQGDGRVLSRPNDISATEIVKSYGNDSRVMAGAEFASAMRPYAKTFASPQIIGFSFVLLTRINATDADTFLRQVFLGEGIRRGDPAFAVRQALMRDRATPIEKITSIFRGWNAFRENRDLVHAKFNGEFPELS